MEKTFIFHFATDELPELGRKVLIKYSKQNKQSSFSNTGIFLTEGKM